MLFGLIGKKLSHSFSAILFKEKFKSKYDYKLFEIENASEVLKLMANEIDLRGLNVTIPFKEEIIKYLNHLDSVALKIGSVNTLFIDKNIIIGYNTDFIGFEKAYMKELIKKHKLALIIGTGGSAKAIAFTLNKYGIPYKFVSRTIRNSETILYENINNFAKDCTMIINATPVGMYPDVSKMPDITIEIFNNKPVVIDIIYNPNKTMLLEKAEKFGCKIYNGMQMLKLQAYESWKIWGIV